MRVLGIDVGGTYTDAVLVDGAVVRTAKVPTARAQEESVVAAARAVGATGAALDRFTHGTTVATNALLERRGARTAFVATEGFEHLLHLRRQDRAHLYRLCASHPEPLVPVERCIGVRERMGPAGIAMPLDLATLPSLDDVEAIAVCLLHAYAHPEHERAVAAELRRRHPAAHVVASHEIAPEIREYERASTTVADAYLGPVLAGYLRRLSAAAQASGLPEPLVMRSSGGVVTLPEAAAHAAWALLSGPAAGVVGAAFVARRAGFPDAIAFDMGGTSTDVCAIVGGEATRESRAHGRRLPDPAARRLPSTPSERAADRSCGATRVGRSGSGRESAGASPGPPATGGAASVPTVTDANLLLGRLPAALPGGIELDTGAAERALGDIDPAAVVAVVDAEMLGALRVVSVEQGHDPRDFALVAFGGAGPLHACALADELGMRTVLVPAAAGMLSALGLASGDERRDTVRGVVAPLETAGELPADGEADLRYAGQSFELTVPLGPALAERFHAAHEARYGYADTALRHRARRRANRRDTARPAARSCTARGWSCSRPAAGRARRRVLLGAGGLGGRDRRRRNATTAAGRMIPVELQVIGAQLVSIAEEMGAVLIRGAFSANIKERHDCSTALFDEQGRMVAQAEHIPVHLGAMPEAVAAVMAHDPQPGEIVDPQRPVRGWDAPARPDDGHADAARVLRHEGAPRRCRRPRAGQPPDVVAHAGRRGRRDPTDAARRAVPGGARRADAQPGGAARRSARAARRAPPRRPHGSRSSAHAAVANAWRPR